VLQITAVYNTAKAHPALSAFAFTKNSGGNQLENAFSCIIATLLHDICKRTITVCKDAEMIATSSPAHSPHTTHKVIVTNSFRTYPAGFHHHIVGRTLDMFATVISL